MNQSQWRIRARRSKVPRIMLTRQGYVRPSLVDKWKRKALRVIFASTVIIIAVALWSPIFSIRSVVVGAAENGVSQQMLQAVSETLQKRRLLLFSNSNLITMPARQLARNILATEQVEKISIQREFPHRLVIKIQWKMPALIVALVPHQDEGGDEKLSPQLLTSHARYVSLSRNGRVIDELNAPKLDGEELSLSSISEESLREQLLKTVTGVPVIYMNTQSSSEVHPGDSIFSDDLVRFIVDATRSLERTGLVSVQSGSVIDPSSTVFTMHTSKGFDVIVSSRENIDSQIAALEEVLSQKAVNESRVSYFDVRIPDRVYYK